MSPVRGCRVDLRTCDWHPEQRHCVAKGNRKCRPWDSSNAREILKHAHAYKSKGLFGFELGNELAAGGGTVSGDRTPGAHPRSMPGLDAALSLPPSSLAVLVRVCSTRGPYLPLSSCG